MAYAAQITTVGEEDSLDIPHIPEIEALHRIGIDMGDPLRTVMKDYLFWAEMRALFAWLSLRRFLTAILSPQLGLVQLQ